MSELTPRQRALLKAISGAPLRPARKSSTVLYLLRHPFRPWLKVGITNNMKARLSTYVTCWGCEPVKAPIVLDAAMIHALGFDSAREMESGILNCFAADCVRTEWSELSSGLLAFEEAAERHDWRSMQKYLGMGRRHLAIA